jgi:hypothetical protein
LYGCLGRPSANAVLEDQIETTGNPESVYFGLFRYEPNVYLVKVFEGWLGSAVWELANEGGEEK